jgi:myo-inositol-1(or 4)-monophosphatase
LDLKKELRLAIESTLEAGKIVSQIYNSSFEVNWKAKDDPLTEADLKANQIIISYIQKKFPEDGILSEEVKDSEERLSKNRVWILDPIDGTREFIEKNPEFSISLGLSINKEAILGVVFNPISREIFFGVVGVGIGYKLLDEDFNFDLENIQLDNPYFISKEFRKPSILVSRTEFYKNKLFDSEYWKSNFEIFPIGSIAYKLALTSIGKVHFTISLKPKSEWDICAGIALVKSSGGVSFDLKNLKEFVFNKKNTYDEGIISGNKDFILEILKDKKEFLKNSLKPF